MGFLTKSEIQKLSFPDYKVAVMQYDIPHRILKIRTNGGYLSIGGGIRLKSCELTLEHWQSMCALLYRTKTKQLEKLETVNLETLVDICEFEYGNKVIIFRGFGSKTGQWIELMFLNANLIVECA